MSYSRMALLALLLIGSPIRAEEIDIYSNGAQGRLGHPSIAWSDGGEMIVAWSQERLGVQVGIYDAAGTPRVGPLVVAADDPVPGLPFHGILVEHRAPSVVPLRGGDALVVWAEEESQVDVDIFIEHRELLDRGVRALRVDRCGVPHGAVVVLDDGAPGEQGAVVGARYADGSVLAAWHEVDGEVTSIWGRRLDAEGAPAGAAFRLDGTGGARPAIAVHRNRALVVWQRADGTGVDGRFVLAGGGSSAAPFEVTAGPDGGRLSPTVAAGEDGRFLVAWQHRDVQVFRVRGRWVDWKGPTGGELALSPEDVQDHAGPVLVGRPDGHFLLAWIAWYEGFRTGVVLEALGPGGAPAGDAAYLSDGTIDAQNRISGAAAPDCSGGFTWVGFDDQDRSIEVGLLPEDPGVDNRCRERRPRRAPVCR